MILGKELIVIMPAYNAALTLRQTYLELPHDYVDEVILVDAASRDETARVAEELGIKTIIHAESKGYGGNQKTCYRKALRHGADIIVMVHADYQYSPRLVAAMASMIASGRYDIVLGSRILGGVLKGGMPLYKYIANRFLTLIENIIRRVKPVKMTLVSSQTNPFIREFAQTSTDIAAIARTATVPSFALEKRKEKFTEKAPAPSVPRTQASRVCYCTSAW